MVLLKPTIPNFTNCTNVSHCLSLIFKCKTLRRNHSIMHSMTFQAFVPMLSLLSLFTVPYLIIIHILSLLHLSIAHAVSKHNR